jgi:hypothetical protein
LVCPFEQQLPVLSRTLAFRLITNEGYHSLAGKFLLVAPADTVLNTTTSTTSGAEQVYATLKSVSVNLGREKSLTNYDNDNKSDFLEIAIDLSDETISS